MNGAMDRNIRLRIDPPEGCAGAVFSDPRDHVAFDLLSEDARQYLNLRPINATLIQNGMKSILCAPIFGPPPGSDLLGLINIDSDRNIRDTPFAQSAFLKALRDWSDGIGQTLSGAGG